MLDKGPESDDLADFIARCMFPESTIKIQRSSGSESWVPFEARPLDRVHSVWLREVSFKGFLD